MVLDRRMLEYLEEYFVPNRFDRKSMKNMLNIELQRDNTGILTFLTLAGLVAIEIE